MKLGLEEFQAKVVDLCREHWQKHQKAYLDSRLGLDLSRLDIDVRGSVGMKLQPFIMQHMTDKLQIRRSPTSGENITILGLFPLDAKLGEPLSAYFDFGPPKTKTPRLNPRFWAAFAVPLMPGFRRFFDLKTFLFEDVPQDQPAPDDKLEIDLSNVVPESVAHRSSEIIHRIRGWLDVNKLPITDFVAGRHLEGPHTYPPLATMEERPVSGTSRTILHALVESLNSRELARITMPLDVVAKLLNATPKDH